MFVLKKRLTSPLLKRKKTVRKTDQKKRKKRLPNKKKMHFNGGKRGKEQTYEC